MYAQWFWHSSCINDCDIRRNKTNNSWERGQMYPYAVENAECRQMYPRLHIQAHPLIMSDNKTLERLHTTSLACCPTEHDQYKHTVKHKQTHTCVKHAAKTHDPLTFLWLVLNSWLRHMTVVSTKSFVTSDARHSTLVRGLLSQVEWPMAARPHAHIADCATGSDACRAGWRAARRPPVIHNVDADDRSTRVSHHSSLQYNTADAPPYLEITTSCTITSSSTSLVAHHTLII